MRKFPNYTLRYLETKEDILDMIREIKHKNISEIILDTETTGVHIKLDKPFLLQFGYVEGDTVYVFEARKKQLKRAAYAVLKLVELKKIALVGHNLSFDLHMLENVGVEIPNIKCIDTTVCIRLAHDALTEANGGPPLGLKEYTQQFIDRSARDFQKKLKEERTAISATLNIELKTMLRLHDRSWTKKQLDEMLSDYLSTPEVLGETAAQVYYDWYYNKVPERIRDNMTTPMVESEDVPYDMLNKDNLEIYAAYDIIYTAEVLYLCMPAIKARKMEDTFNMECDYILPILRMEDTGFAVNKDYIIETRIKLKEYILARRERLKELVGEYVKPSQAKVIKDTLEKKFGVKVESTGKEILNTVIADLKHTGANPEALEFIEILQELRTLDKWYQTYLMRFVREIQKEDRIYTTIFSAGTVTGRITSDFQQFPKYGIRTYDDQPLFDPRRMVKVTDGFSLLTYIDYSQIELRLQAMYTILVGHPDLNLCRAYMPYQCKTIIDDGGIGCGQYQYHYEEFDYNNKEHIKHAYDWKWYLNENLEQEWIPTDVHAATTHKAFPDLDTHSDEFKKLRGKIGKRVNFAKNYGAQYAKIKEMFPEYDDDEIKRIDDSYYAAFPGVKEYHNYCYNLAKSAGYGTNLFGRRYYGVSGHKLINALIQGSGADMLKRRIIALDKYIRDKKLKSRLQMQIHDELCFEIYPGEEKEIFEFQRIMQDYPEALVPIVAEIEISKTTWADKQEVNTLEEVEVILNEE